MSGRISKALALGLLVAGIAVTAAAQETKPATPNAPAQKTDVVANRGGQPVNIRLDLTITEQREGAQVPPRTLTMMVADRDRGQIRSGGTGDQMLNVDARPDIVRDGRVRVFLTFDYRAPRTDLDKTPPMLTQSITTVLDDGKPLVVSQWTEGGTGRTIKVELKTSIQK